MPATAYLRRHPRTGIYWFRRAVPVALRAVVGRCEIVRSLKTRDRREARRLALVHAVEAENILAQAQGRSTLLPTSSSPPAARDLAALIEAAVRKALHVAPSTPEPPLNGLRLDEAFQRYDGERRLRPQARIEFLATIRRFREVVGEDRSVAAISKADVRAFKEALMAMPKRMTAKERDMPLPQLLAGLDGKAVERVSLTTVRKAMGMLQTVLGWCVKNGYLESNPAAGLKPTQAENGKLRRLPYDAEDLKTIFSSPLYTGCASGTRRWAPGRQVIRDACFWLPLLGLHTGCRLEELGQLTLADVKEEDGIAFLDINDLADGQSLKTKGSRRRVPLHPKVIEAGFLAYVAALRKRGETRVFPDLLRNPRGKTTAAWSKWWGRYTAKIGIIDPRKVFHSFRHAFKDACRAAGIEEAIHDALTGHAAPHVGRSYGRGYSLAVLAEAMVTLDFVINLTN